MKEKQCCRCKQFYPATTEYFHNYHRAKDGLYSRCKTCRKEYFQTEHGSKIRCSNDLKYRQKHKVKTLALLKVSCAVKTGRLPSIHTRVCIVCGEKAKEYHHWSYEEKYWLDVIPVCSICHKKIHRSETLTQKVIYEYKQSTVSPYPIEQ